METGGAWARLYQEAAEPQQGAVSSQQAASLGIPLATFHEHVRAHAWARLLPGVWGVPGSADSYERRCWAALLAVPHGVLTAESALWHAGLLRREPPRTALLLPPRTHMGARESFRFHRGRWVVGDRVEDEGGLRRAPLLRALTDFAVDHSQRRTEYAIAALHRLRHATPEDVRAYLERRGRFPGRRKALAALDAVAGEVTHSGEERHARDLLRAADLPWLLHPRPLAIRVGGRYVAEIDLPWPQVRYGIEVDGPHHHLPQVASADRARDRQLARLDWVIDRFLIEDIRQDPHAFVSQARAGLQAAAARDVSPWQP